MQLVVLNNDIPKTVDPLLLTMIILVVSQILFFIEPYLCYLPFEQYIRTYIYNSLTYLLAF